MRNIRILLLGLVALGIMGSQAIGQDKPIIIGNMADFTGTYAAMSKMQKDSVDMAVAEINNSGGLLGRKVKVIDEDTQTSTSIAARKMERLVLEEKADFLIAPVTSASTLAIMPLAQKYNKLLMVPMSQSIKITGEDKNKQTFRVCANPSITAKGLVKWMLANLGKKVYLLNVDYAWGRSTSEVYNKLLKEMGANIVGETFFPLNTKDFAPYFGRIKAAKPDILFITAAGNDSISVLSQAEQYGLKKLMHICGDGSLVSSDILGALGSSANSIITADYYADTLNTPANNAWVARYKKLYGASPSKFSVSSYEAVMWAAQAIKKAGSLDTQKIIAALEGSTYNGPQGVKVMDSETHQTSLVVYMIKIDNGLQKIFAKGE
ncbi:MAG: ABC transporter substrate-binding protein [Deltaproteobacteria bacterium]|nr:ABC transporter substrate-binding protein [Deltaproteobacteria bacterium]